MITLATLPQATEQEVFEQVAKHLLTQNKKSFEFDTCRYRGPNGLKCAAGCLISDEEYIVGFEGTTWAGLFNLPYSCLIQGLQDIHDNEDVQDWKQSLFNLAVQYNLNTSFMDEL